MYIFCFELWIYAHPSMLIDLMLYCWYLLVLDIQLQYLKEKAKSFYQHKVHKVFYMEGQNFLLTFSFLTTLILVGIKMIKKNCTDDMRICPPAWNLFHQTCYFQSENQVSWVEGQRHCRRYFGSLAKITSYGEMVRFLFKTLLTIWRAVMWDTYLLILIS